MPTEHIPQIRPDMTVVNVNRNTINSNTKHGTNEPPIRVQKGKSGKADYGHEVAVLDAAGNEVARFVYNAEGKIVSCGARLVLLAHHGAKVVSPGSDRVKNADTGVDCLN